MGNLIKNYKANDIIFLSELYNNYPTINKDCIRKNIERLIKQNFLIRYSTGIYYIPSYSITGKLKVPDINSVITQKYMSFNDKVFGFYSGITLLNNLGICNQIPNIQEIITNKESSRKRKVTINNFHVIIRKPVVEITNNNYKILQLLDLLKYIDKYKDIPIPNIKKIIAYNYLSSISNKEIYTYLPLYPAYVTKIFIKYELNTMFCK